MKNQIVKVGLIAGSIALMSSVALASPKCHVPHMLKAQVAHMPSSKQEKIKQTFKTSCMKYKRIKYSMRAKRAMLNAVLMQPKINQHKAKHLTKQLVKLYRKRLMLATRTRIKLNQLGLRVTPAMQRHGKHHQHKINKVEHTKK